MKEKVLETHIKEFIDWCLTDNNLLLIHGYINENLCMRYVLRRKDEDVFDRYFGDLDDAYDHWLNNVRHA